MESQYPIKYLLKVIPVLTLLFTCFLSVSAQDYSETFADKIEKMGVEFYYPIETKIKRKENVEDDFLKYDLILKSRRNFEIRYFLNPHDNSKSTSFHPHVEITRTIANIATNDEVENIRMTSIPNEEAQRRFGADWAIYADFVPKKSFSGFPIGRIISLYKEDRGYLNCILLYKKDNLDAFMGLPVRFKRIDDY